MARMKINLPEQFTFKMSLRVCVDDLNYGNHMANQQFLVFAQEARIAFFKKFGFSELDFGGTSLIQADAAIQYKGEGHLNDEVEIEVASVLEGNSSFNLYYRFYNVSKQQEMAVVRTALIAYDYQKGKPVKLSEEALKSGIFNRS
jgi:acyl-CoA thioester hydrolase